MNSINREQLKKELLRDEGMRLTSYQDTVGLWTIGVGHLLGKERRMTSITLAECNALFDVDIDEAERVVVELIPEFAYWPSGYNETRARALVNMGFNLGPRLGSFVRFLGAVRGDLWRSAAVYMLQSKWAKQVGARAVRLRDQILTED